MPNQLFNMMNGGNNGMGNFMQFMQQMRGQNPQAMLNQMLQSGRISQEQLNAAQAQAKQMSGAFEQFKGNFGFR